MCFSNSSMWMFDQAKTVSKKELPLQELARLKDYIEALKAEKLMLEADKAAALAQVLRLKMDRAGEGGAQTTATFCPAAETDTDLHRSLPQK